MRLVVHTTSWLLLFSLLTATIFSVYANIAEAQPSYTINYQGKLTTPTGVAVADGTYSIEFNLYTVASGGSAIWTETRSGGNEVTIENGLFSVMLGSVSSLTSVNFNQPLYLGVTIEADAEMTPRKAIGSVPSAFEAKQLGGVASSSFLRSDQADTAGSLLTFNGGLISNSSSTLARLSFTNATGTSLFIGGDRITDFVGSGLTLSGTTLTATLGADITAAEIANGDHGFFSYASGVASLDSGGLTSANLSTALTNETGSGAVVFGTSPTFTTNINLGTAGVRISDDGDGAITFLGLGNGSDENLTLNLDDNANLGSFTSSTGLDRVYFDNIGVTGYTYNGTASVSGYEEYKASSFGIWKDNVNGADVTVYGQQIDASVTDSGAGNSIVYGSAIGTGIGNNDADTTYGQYIGAQSLSGVTYGLYVDSYNAGGTAYSAIFSTGNVGIGTSTPASKLTVAGDLRVTGAFRDTSGDAGVSGQVLLSTLTGTNWVATSSLGFVGGLSAGDIDTSAEIAALLTDETGTGSVVFSGSPTFTGTISAAAATLSSTLTMSGSAANIALGSNYLSGDGGDEGVFVDGSGNVGIGLSSLSSKFTVNGTTYLNDALRVGNSGSFTPEGLHFAISPSSLNSTDSSFIFNGATGFRGLSTFNNDSAIAVDAGYSSSIIAVVGQAALTEAASGNHPLLGTLFLKAPTITGGTATVANTATLYIEGAPSATVSGANMALWVDAGATQLDGTLGVTGASTFSSTLTMSGSAANIALGSNYLSGDGGDEGIAVTSGGNVGVGTSSPTYLFSVDGGSATSLYARNTNASAPIAIFQTTGGLYGPHGFIQIGATNGLTLAYEAQDENARIKGKNALFLGTSAGDTLSINSGRVGIGLNSSYPDANALLEVSANGGGTDLFMLSSTQALHGDRFVVKNNGNTGIGTSSPSSKLSVAGDLYVTGAFRDSSGDAGTNGQLLLSTLTGTNWTATSSLGLGNGSFLGLNDTFNSYTVNRIPYSSSSALIDSANFTFDGTRLAVGGVIGGGLAGSGFTISRNSPSTAYTTASLASIHNRETVTSAGIATGMSVNLEAAPTGNTSRQYVGITSTVIGTPSAERDTSLLAGVLGLVSTGQINSPLVGGVIGQVEINNALADIDFAGGISGVIVASAGDVTRAVGLNSELYVEGANVTDAIGMYVPNNVLNSGTLTNSYGLYLEDQVDGTNNWNLYVAGATANNYIAGNLGVGTSSPMSKFTVAGDARITGSLRDSSGDAGSNGMVLLSTGSGTNWVATSSLGISSGSGSLFTDGGANTYLTATGDRLSIGGTGGTARLNVYGDIDLATNDGAISFMGERFIYASSTTNTFMVGFNAGPDDTTNAEDSNFIGRNAGSGATSAHFSNFLGWNAGVDAINASSANFLGPEAGYEATGAYLSNFIGAQAGAGATDAYESNFIGGEAGSGATDAYFANFIGSYAGQGAINAHDSNFIGFDAGFEATDAYFSNFMGSEAGAGATNANNSNFFGQYAGSSATSAHNSNFFGQSAGYGATNANHSNFIGLGAGNGATSASNSNFFGREAGQDAIDADSSNFIGLFAGRYATNANYSNFLGMNAGVNAADAAYSNFLGLQAGDSAASSSFSNFFGRSAGYGATDATYSNFFGSHAGYEATDANHSNFIGSNAGYGASGAAYANFLGDNAGYGAIDANYGNFIGEYAGYEATNANNSNFIGQYAGRSATYAGGSNFFGTNAGRSATNASDSIFIGNRAGYQAADANNSIFIGYYAGNLDSVNNSAGSTSIAIGRYSGTGGFSDSIALGRGVINSAARQLNIGNVLYATGIYSSDTQSSAPLAGNIGIGTSTAPYRFAAIGSSLFQNSGQSYTWTNGSAPSTALVRLGLDSNGNGLVIKAPNTGTVNSLLGIFDSFGTNIFSVNGTGVSFGGNNRVSMVNGIIGGTNLNLSGITDRNVLGATATSTPALLIVDDRTAPATERTIPLMRFAFNDSPNNTQSTAGINAISDSTNRGLAFYSYATTSSSFVENMRLFSSGNVGIGTTSASSKLTVGGDLRVTGAFRDSSNDAGSNGMVLLSTGTGTNWVATSSLGISGGSVGADSLDFDDFADTMNLDANLTVNLSGNYFGLNGGGAGAVELDATGLFLTGSNYYIDDGSGIEMYSGDISIDTGGLYAAEVISNASIATGYAAQFLNDGDNTNRYGILIQAGLDDDSTPGTNKLIQFNDGNGGSVGTVEFGGDILTIDSGSNVLSLSDTLVITPGLFIDATQYIFANAGLQTPTLTLTGELLDNSSSAGSNGMVLMSTGTGVDWVATSSLGISGGSVGADSLNFTDFSDAMSLDASTSIALDGSETLTINSTSSVTPFAVNTNVASAYVASFINDGDNVNRYGLLVQAGLDNASAAGPSTLMQFNDGDGTLAGSIKFGSDSLQIDSTASSILALGENSAVTTLGNTVGSTFLQGTISVDFIEIAQLALGVSMYAGPGTSIQSSQFAVASDALLTSTDAQFLYNGASGLETVASFSLDAGSTLSSNYTGSILSIANDGVNFTEAASGNHPLIGTLLLKAPGITGGSATVSNTATLYIEGAPSATVSGANMALWVDAGNAVFDGSVGIGDTTPDSQVDINSSATTGNILEIGADSGVTLAGTLIGARFDLSTNYTATNQAVRGIQITTPAATNSGTVGLQGVRIAGGNITTTAGATTFTGVYSNSPNLTQTGGTATANGFEALTGTNTTGGTQNGLLVTAAGVSVGALNGVSISNITAGGGTEYAVNIGTGWDRGINSLTTGINYFAGTVGVGDASPDARLDIDTTITSGTIFGSAAPSGVTVAGALTGYSLDLRTNYTATGQSVTGIRGQLPNVANTGAGTYNYNLADLGTSGATLTQGTGAGVSTFRGLSVTNPNITQTTGTVVANGAVVTTGTITTNGTQNGVLVTGQGVGAGTLNGINIAAITGGAGTENAINVGTGYDKILESSTFDINGTGFTVINPSNTVTTGNVISLSYGTGVTLTGQYTGFSQDYTSFFTATNQSVTGYSATLPAVTNTGSGTYNYRGTTIAAAGALVQNTAAGNSTFTGTYITNPNITQTTGTVTANGVYVNTGTITTGGSQNGIYVNGQGVSAGAMAGIKFGTISGGAGLEDAISIGDGYDNLLNSNNYYITGQGLTTISPPSTLGSGNLIGSAAPSGITLSNWLYGVNLDLRTNYTVTDENVTAFNALLPNVSNSSTQGSAIAGLNISGGTMTTTGSANNFFNGISISGGTITQGSSGFSLFTGLGVTNPNITVTSGLGIAAGISVTTGSITSGGTQGGVSIVSNGVSAGSLFGLDVSNITGGAGVEYAVSVGTGWDYGIYSGSRLFVSADNATAYAGEFFNDGNNQNRYGLKVQGGADDGSGTTYYLDAYDGDGGQVGYLANVAGTFGVTDISDIRTKTNVTNTEIVNATEVINGLRVVDFNRIQDPNGPRITGFIAQEVQALYPFAVTENESGFLGIMKDAFVPLLVKGAQEQQLALTSQGGQLTTLAESLANTITSIADLEDSLRQGFSDGYDSNEEIEQGTIVTLAGDGNKKIEPAKQGNPLLGVVTQPVGLILDSERTIAVAQAGKVMVKVNMEGGDISIGDAITLSSQDGVGTKATTTSRIVGIALEEKDEEGSVLVTVQNELYFTADTTTALNDLFVLPENATDSNDTLWSRLKTLATNFVDGVLTTTGLNADRVDVAEELCVDGVCVNGDDLRALLESANRASEPEPTPETPVDPGGEEPEPPVEEPPVEPEPETPPAEEPETEPIP